MNDYVTTTVSSSTNTTMSDQYDTKMHDPVVNMVNVETISWYDVYMFTNRPLNTRNMRKQCSELKVKISRKYVTTLGHRQYIDRVHNNVRINYNWKLQCNL